MNLLTIDIFLCKFLLLISPQPKTTDINKNYLRKPFPNRVQH